MINQWDGSVIFLGTDDLQKTHEFYSGLLELVLFKDQGDCRIYEIPKGGRIGFCSGMQVVKGRVAPEITLLAEDVEFVHAHIKASGYENLPLPVVDTKYNIYHFEIKDPNGYTVVIHKFLD